MSRWKQTCAVLGAVSIALTVSADRAYEKQFAEFKLYTVEVSTGRSNAWITRIEDTKAGNTCYVYDLGRAMSCVPAK
jgi:hypothetical protein